MAKARAGGEETAPAVRSTGVQAMARRERHAEQIGEALQSRPSEAGGQRPAWTKKISQREGWSASDEAIVSDDPGGQQNLQASQGPLDWIVP